jgi:AbiTii-like protein
MTLLEQIQNEAVDGSSDLGTLLRKCRVLAAKLKNPAFTDWAIHELDGYPEDSDIPSYRVLRGQPYGSFIGAMGAGLKSVPLRETDIHERARQIILVRKFNEGVASIQATYEGYRHSDLGLRSAWPADFFSFYQSTTVAEHLVLAQAWTLFSVEALAGMLSTIRNRILNFVLEIAELNPDAGEAQIGKPAIPPEKTAQVFNNTIHIHGNVTNLAGGNVERQTSTSVVRKGDLNSLRKFLETAGLPKAEITGLETALKSEPNPPSVESPGPIGRWWNNIKGKLGSGAISLLVAGGEEALKQGIDSYFGH